MDFKAQEMVKMTYIKTNLHREIVIDSIITLHYFEYMKDFVFRGEAHDFWEFLYVDKGTVSVRSDDRWLTLNTGDVIFHKPNEFHAIKSIGKNAPNLVVISFTSHSEGMKYFENMSCTLDKSERYLISQIITEAKDTFSTPIHIPSVEQVLLREKTPFASQQLILLYLELFLITVHRNHQSIHALGASSERLRPTKHFQLDTVAAESLENSDEKDSSKNILFQHVIQYLEFHICESLSVPQICSSFSVSRSALQALFHEKLGCGVIEHFNKMKIDRAKDIIRDGNMNLTEIAYYLSYSSLPYFSKQFKKETGMSPLQYSNSVKGITEALRKSEE